MRARRAIGAERKTATPPIRGVSDLLHCRVSSGARPLRTTRVRRAATARLVRTDTAKTIVRITRSDMQRLQNVRPRGARVKRNVRQTSSADPNLTGLPNVHPFSRICKRNPLTYLDAAVECGKKRYTLVHNNFQSGAKRLV